MSRDDIDVEWIKHFCWSNPHFFDSFEWSSHRVAELIASMVFNYQGSLTDVFTSVRDVSPEELVDFVVHFSVVSVELDSAMVAMLVRGFKRLRHLLEINRSVTDAINHLVSTSRRR